MPLVGHCGSARESLVGAVTGVALLWMAFALAVKPASQSIHLMHIAVPHLAGLDPMTYLRLHFHVPSLSQLAADLAKSTHTHIPTISPKG